MKDGAQVGACILAFGYIAMLGYACGMKTQAA